MRRINVGRIDLVFIEKRNDAMFCTFWRFQIRTINPGGRGFIRYLLLVSWRLTRGDDPGTLHVYPVGYRLKMVRANTRACLAKVVEFQSCGNFPLGDRPNDPVS
jgi:hypothetical protein